MVRYLIAQGADCRKTDTYGRWPRFLAAANGHLEIMKLLSQVGGTHEDIRRVSRGQSPLHVALYNNHSHIWKWLIRKGAMEGLMDDTTLRENLRKEDHRRAILSWAHDAVTAHDNFQLFLTATPLFSRDETRTSSSSSLSSSLLVQIFHRHQPPDILKVIAQYVEENTEHELRTFRQLLDRLPRFMNTHPSS